MTVVRLLGPVDVVDSAGRVRVPGSPIRATLLALIGLDAGRVVEAEWLLDQAWDGKPPPSGLRALRFHISKLRAELGIDGLIVTVGTGYRIEARNDIGDAERARSDGTLSAAGAAAALDLWRGEALSGTKPCLGLEHEQIRLSELRIDLFERRFRALAAQGEVAAVIGDLSRLCLDHPLREGLWATLIAAHYRAGNQSEALRCYDQLRLALIETSGIDPMPEIQQLYDDVLHQREHLQSPGGHSSAEWRVGNLPERRTSLIGCLERVAQVHDLLDDYRLVTLTGVGGVGKTSLALEVARSGRDSYPHGCWLVELGSVLEDDQVITTVLSSLGIQPQGGATALDALCASLAGLELLVILDNCEHVLRGVVELAERVLDSIPDIQIMATSREGLGLRGEYQLTVPSLETNGPDSQAAQLFRRRADEHGWTAIDHDDAVIEDLCARLDGIPLAIELAAARARSMTATQLRDRLGRRFRLLKGVRRGVERHQTLQATVAWSYDLLTADERSLFDRLCVFTGPFELRAAEHVFGDDEFDELMVGELLGSLVNRSMLTVHDGVFSLLETMRQFAEDRIDDDLVERTRREHAGHYRSFVVEAHDGHLGPDEGAWSQRFETAWPNVRAAFGWALQNGDTGTALTIVAHLGLAPINHRHIVEIHGWAQAAIELPGAPDEPFYTSCLAVASVGCHLGGDFKSGEALAQRAGAARNDFGFDLDQLALSSLALTLQIGGRTDQSICVFERRVEAAADGPPAVLSMWLSELAVWQATNLHDAKATADASVLIADGTGNPSVIGFALYAKGVVTVAEDPAGALGLYEESSAVMDAASLPWLAGMCDQMKAHALMDLGRPQEALELGLHTGRRLQRKGNVFMMRVSILACARALGAMNDPTNAALLYGAEGWANRSDMFSVRRDLLQSRLVEVLGEAALAELTERGEELSMPQALDLADAAAEAIGASITPRERDRRSQGHWSKSPD